MVTFVHIPRTGGLALTEALRGSGVVTQGHQPRLSTVEDAITIVRDPLTRFLSAYDHQRPDLDIEELARDPSLGGWFFAPMTHWLDADRPVLWVGHTETLAADVERLGTIVPMAPLPHRYNASSRTSRLSPEGAASVRAYYAGDYALLDRIS